MASARLIPKSIYNDRIFLQLPLRAQHLMTYLILYSDNDGIVEAYAVMNIIHASLEDLLALSEKRFIYVLDESWTTYIVNFQKFNHFDRRNFRVSQHRELLIQVHPELECELVKPQKRNRNKEIPRNPMGSHGEEKRIEGNETKYNTLQLKQQYDFEQIEQDILSN